MTQTGIFQPRRLAHVNFWVEDYEKINEFYQDVVGLEEAYRRPDFKGIFLSNGNTYHDSALFDVTGSRRGVAKPGLHHFAFELENEIDLVEGYKRIGELGFKFDHNFSADVAHCCYGHDPEGNRFEVYADVKPNWREERTGTIETGASNPVYVPGESPPVAERCYPVDPEIHEIKDAVFHTRRAGHVTLVAKDYEALFDHYTKLVGLTPLVGGLDDPFVILSGTTGVESMAIFRSQPGWKSGLHHGGFEIENDAELDRSRKLLHERAIAIDKEADHPARRAIHISDPCGNPLQFFVNGAAPLESLLELPPEQAIYLA